MATKPKESKYAAKLRGLGFERYAGDTQRLEKVFCMNIGHTVPFYVRILGRVLLIFVKDETGNYWQGEWKRDEDIDLSSHGFLNVSDLL